MVALPAVWKQRREKPKATERHPLFLAGVSGNVDGGREPEAWGVRGYFKLPLVAGI